MPAALFHRGFNSVPPFSGILNHKFALLIDVQAAVIRLGLQQKERKQSVYDEVVNLSSLSIRFEPQIVEHREIFTIPK